ncbi:hypothetical protein AXF14_02910 [Actinomyces radicidentis]|uniref:Glycosyltransferase 2-like domain-containing protein n=1 Tax=Actinomyces radicidentis TaxID=111015 RepID=A0A0X8JDX9_ACTRD|nr:glycosyltransferase [Actinomyces radicidentis]AMD86742.1 hypothetical protein AXF14_02910 [Actinomyces radicidentis]
MSDTLPESRSPKASVAVAVLTYKRPDHAAQLVPVLDAAMSEVTDDRPLRLIVVDNDPEATAREIIAAGAATAVHEVTYVHEPEPGIAAARNAALEACTEDAIVFIDDDERPETGWLPALIATWEETGAEAVVGPVLPDFEVEPDPWVVAGGWFDHGRHTTGYVMPAAATNNLLLEMATMRRLGLRFDLGFGISGGSDTMLTRTLIRDGGRIVWCDEAVVNDEVPAKRLTRQWVTRRAYRSGNSWASVDLALARQEGRGAEIRSRLHQGLRGAERVALGSVMVAAALLRGSERAHSKSVRFIQRGRGMVAGALGSKYMEYKRS